MSNCVGVDGEIAAEVVQKNFYKLQQVDQDWLLRHLYSLGLVHSTDKAQQTGLLSTICDGLKRDSSKFLKLIELFRTDSANSYISSSLKSDYCESVQ